MSPIQEPPLIVMKMALSERQQIGSARMEQDGTIVLRVRMIEASSVGDAETRYVPGTSDYERVRKHLPFLTPGRSIPVYNDWK